MPFFSYYELYGSPGLLKHVRVLCVFEKHRKGNTNGIFISELFRMRPLLQKRYHAPAAYKRKVYEITRKVLRISRQRQKDETDRSKGRSLGPFASRVVSPLQRYGILHRMREGHVRR